jgi:hypothetical protein
MTLTNGDEPHYLVMTYNLIHKGNLDHLEKVYKSKVFAPWYGADDVDAHLIAIPGIKNKVYAYHLPGLSFLLIPGFLVNALYGSTMTMVLCITLGLVFTYKLLLYYVDKEWSLFTTVVIGLSLPVGTYANLIYPETPLFAFVSAILMIILHKKFRLHPANVLIISLLAIAPVILHIKFIVITGIIMLYINFISFKKYPKLLITLDLLVVLGIGAYMTWLNSYYDWKLTAALSAIAAGTKLSILEIPSGLLGVLVDRENGFLIYSPFYIYFLYGIIPMIKKSLKLPLLKAAHTIFPLLLSAGFTCFYTMFPYVMGGVSPSGRYSLPVVPAMAVLIAIGFQTQSRFKWQRYIISALSFYSICIFSIISWNPLLSMPGQMENKIFFFLLKDNAHRIINVYLPNLSKYHRNIPIIDYIKGIGVFMGLILLTGSGNIVTLGKNVFSNNFKKKFN